DPQHLGELLVGEFDLGLPRAARRGEKPLRGALHDRVRRIARSRLEKLREEAIRVAREPAPEANRIELGLLERRGLYPQEASRESDLRGCKGRDVAVRDDSPYRAFAPDKCN